LYLIVDALLLADIFESFRHSCMDMYGLDPLWYCSLPRMSIDASLKMSNERIELIRDVTMYNVVENAIRGGYSVVHHRYAHANFPDMPDYDEEKELSHIILLDINAMYSKAHPLTPGILYYAQDSLHSTTVKCERN